MLRRGVIRLSFMRCNRQQKVGKVMNNDEFIKLAKGIVVGYFNENADKTDNKQITEDDVFVVWSCKTLQNNKALLSTTVSDGMYYEITHNGDKQETYVDAYKKWENFAVKQKNIEV